MEILFEDKEIIVCIKPCGVLSQSDEAGRENMISILQEHTGGMIYPLHRLDKEVSGVMVYAKTKFAAATLSKDIADHNFKKEYIALVHSKPKEESGEMRDLLFKDSKRNKTYVVKTQRKGVKEAVLEYNLIKTKDNISSVLVLLHTGRTHQIRVQFASRGMPLIADKKYGAKDDFKEFGLCSYQITFNHPKTKEQMQFSANPKGIFSEYI